MTEDRHFQHRPPIDKDASTLGKPPPHTTLFGNFYPLNDVIAVIDERAKGEQAVQALKDAGIPDGDVDLLDGQWFAEAVRGLDRHGGIAARLAKFLPMDERLIVQRYIAEAEQGSYIIVVHAEQRDQMERVSRILAEFGAHEARHYGPSVITDLWPAAH
jgi:hypothetical protein